MEDRRKLEFGRSKSAEDRLIRLAPDLARSYQWPFHLRIHPDYWEIHDGAWRLCIERVNLRPGVGGVGGKANDLSSFNDLSLMQNWAKAEDGQWLLLQNGDMRLVDLFDDGRFIEAKDVSSAGKSGTVIIAEWDVLSKDGTIYEDEDRKSEIAAVIALQVLGLTGPTEAAVRRVVGKLRALLNQLEVTAAKAEYKNSKLNKRIKVLREKLYFATGDADYNATWPPKDESREPAAKSDLASLIEAFGEDAIIAMLEAKKAKSQGGAADAEKSVVEKPAEVKSGKARR